MDRAGRAAGISAVVPCEIDVAQRLASARSSRLRTVASSPTGTSYAESGPAATESPVQLFITVELLRGGRHDSLLKGIRYPACDSYDYLSFHSWTHE